MPFPIDGGRERDPRAPDRLGGSVIASTLVFLVALLSVGTTLPDYGYAIDEATYLWVARAERAWFAKLPFRPLAESFSEAALADGFHYLEPPGANGPDQHSNLNLPVSHHLLNLGWLIGHWFTDERTAGRLGSVGIFAVAAALLTATVARRAGVAAGLFAGLGLVFVPRVFGHAHLAATETALGSLWLLALIALARMEDASSVRARRGWSIAFACLVGLTLGTKLTGWFLLPAAGLWLVVRRPPGWIAACVLTLSLTPLLVYALTPPLWRHPLARFVEYVATVERDPWRIPTYYLGRGYWGHPPASSAVVLILVTTPLSILLLALVGMTRAPRDGFACLLLLSFLLLLLGRMVGLVPGHDGERQFLPCWYFLAGLAGIGFGALARRISQRGPLVAFFFAACLVEPAAELWKFRAHGLSYYNRAVGGLKGAVDAGFETSYWFEAMTDADWRAAFTDLPKGSKVFLRPDHPGFADLRAGEVIPADVTPTGPEAADYYLLYAKSAAYILADPATGEPIVTDLARAQRQAPALIEKEFDGVRLFALIPSAPVGN